MAPSGLAFPLVPQSNSARFSLLCCFYQNEWSDCNEKINTFRLSNISSQLKESL